jgi:hypothetical protein
LARCAAGWAAFFFPKIEPRLETALAAFFTAAFALAALWFAPAAGVAAAPQGELAAVCGCACGFVACWPCWLGF